MLTNWSYLNLSLSHRYIDGLVQYCSISIGNAVEILQFCTKSSTYVILLLCCCFPSVCVRGIKIFNASPLSMLTCSFVILLKYKGSHRGKFVNTGCTRWYHHDNIQCSQCWGVCPCDDIYVSLILFVSHSCKAFVLSSKYHTYNIFHNICTQFCSASFCQG